MGEPDNLIGTRIRQPVADLYNMYMNSKELTMAKQISIMVLG